MAKVSLKPMKFHPFELLNQWSVTAKHGVPLIIDERPTVLGENLSLDVEDDGQGNFVGLGVYSPELNKCFYWSSLESLDGFQFGKFIAHNGISDIRKLQKWGFKVDGSHLFHDTQLMQHILDSSQKSYGLKDICKREGIGEWPSYTEIVGKSKTLKDFPVSDVAAYNACDCYYTYKLYEKQYVQSRVISGVSGLPKESDKNVLYFHQIEQPASAVFKSMEERGIRIDVPYLHELQAKLEAQKAPIEKEIKNELGDINLNSPKQLLGALHAKEIYPEFKGKASTDKRALERLAKVPIVRSLQKYSELETLLSSFVIPYLERKEEVVHPFFNQCGTRTGRPSCSNPNLLQIPRKTDNGKLVRRMFIPRENNLFGDCDFGQIEPRILAHMSRDPNLLDMFNSDVDFHTYTANSRGIDREKAKVLNLSVGYRASFKSVSQQLGCSDQEAQKEIDGWWALFPGLRAWQTQLIWQTKRDGYFTTLMGRRIKVDNLNEYNKWKREAAERQLVNNVAQASAAEVMKIAMSKVYRELEGIHLLVQVYDELLFEDTAEDIENTLHLVKDKMEQSVKLDVPLVVDGKTGCNWAVCK